MISSFSGEYRFLSNFYIEPDDTNVEAEFQSSKAPNTKITSTTNPYLAKKIGRRVKLRQDWDFVKRGIMGALVLRKFQDHEILKNLLLSTEDEELVEGNTWNDTYWGVCNGKGENNLGKILMTVRKFLRENRE